MLIRDPNYPETDHGEACSHSEIDSRREPSQREQLYSEQVTGLVALISAVLIAILLRSICT
ncbi:hypothetical protein [Planctomycetes bacterium K23_9]|uniref:Uncharacterized protein n=1 Tax=Stieleria marina TaxID=1930275 RepID=A0A517NVJ5_9BACT|nr:hypothetical protein K239x_31350 [Planctomycetes bacterium K23_9]